MLELNLPPDEPRPDVHITKAVGQSGIQLPDGYKQPQPDVWIVFSFERDLLYVSTVYPQGRLDWKQFAVRHMERDQIADGPAETQRSKQMALMMTVTRLRQELLANDGKIVELLPYDTHINKQEIHL